MIELLRSGKSVIFLVLLRTGILWFGMEVDPKEVVAALVSSLDVVSMGLSGYLCAGILEGGSSGVLDWSLVHNVHQLNDVTIAHKAPLTRMDDILKFIANAQFRESLLHNNGFHHTVIAEEDKTTYPLFTNGSA